MAPRVPPRSSSEPRQPLALPTLPSGPADARHWCVYVWLVATPVLWCRYPRLRRMKVCLRISTSSCSLAMTRGCFAPRRATIRERQRLAAPEGTPTQLMVFTIGPGFDGVKDLHKSIATCPPYAGVHGEIWAGDGYLASLYLDGDSPTDSELAIESAVGVEPTCEF
jgi:hypothetical protein